MGETTLNSLQNGIQSTMYNVQREIGAKLRLKIEKKVFLANIQIRFRIAKRTEEIEEKRKGNQTTNVRFRLLFRLNGAKIFFLT